MKLLAKLIAVILIALAIIFAVLYYNPQLLGSAVKSLAQHSLSNNIMSVKIGDVESTRNLITFKNIILGDEKLKKRNSN